MRFCRYMCYDVYNHGNVTFEFSHWYVIQLQHLITDAYYWQLA